MADRYDAWASALRAGATDVQARHESMLAGELDRARARLAALGDAARALAELPAARERVQALRTAVASLRARAAHLLAARSARVDARIARCRALVARVQASEDRATCAEAAAWLGVSLDGLAEALDAARAAAWRADAARRVAGALAGEPPAPDASLAERLRARGVAPAVLAALETFDTEALRDYLETFVEPRIADARREDEWR